MKGRLFVGVVRLGLFISFSLLCVAQTPAKEKVCTQVLSVLSYDPKLEPFELWLRKNLLLGWEVTFQNEVMASIPHFWATKGFRTQLAANAFSRAHRRSYDLQTHSRAELRRQLLSTPDYLNREQAEEILRFVFQVIKPRSGFLNLFSKNQKVWSPEFGRSFGVHTSNGAVSFLLKDANGRDLTANFEDGAIEVNRAPILYEGHEQAWAEIFDSAHGAGFVGSTAYASGSGGANLHLGFLNLATNPFLRVPDLLPKLILYILAYPEVAIALDEVSTLGHESTTMNYQYLYSRSNPDSARKRWNRIFDYYLKTKNYQRPEPKSEKGAKRTEAALDAMIPKFLKEHDSFINLKHGPSRAELRFIRAAESWEDLDAVALLMIRLLTALPTIEFISNPFASKFAPAPHQWSPLQAEYDFGNLLNALQLPESTQAKLKTFGSVNVFGPAKSQVTTKGDFAEEFKVASHWQPPTNDWKVSLKIPAFYKSERIESLVINGIKMVFIPESSFKVINFDIEPVKSNFYLVTLMGEKDRPLSTISLEGRWIQGSPALDGYFQFEITESPEPSLIKSHAHHLMTFVNSNLQLMNDQLKAAGLDEGERAEALARLNASKLDLVFLSVPKLTRDQAVKVRKVRIGTLTTERFNIIQSLGPQLMLLEPALRDEVNKGPVPRIDFLDERDRIITSIKFRTPSSAKKSD